MSREITRMEGFYWWVFSSVRLMNFRLYKSVMHVGQRQNWMICCKLIKIKKPWNYYYFLIATEEERKSLLTWLNIGPGTDLGGPARPKLPRHVFTDVFASPFDAWLVLISINCVWQFVLDKLVCWLSFLLYTYIYNKKNYFRISMA